MAKTKPISGEIDTKPRVRKNLKHRTLRLSRYTQPNFAPLLTAFGITKKSCKLLWRYRKAFSLLALLYFILYVLLVRGASTSVDVAGIKQNISQVVSGGFSQLGASLTIVGLLLAGSVSGTSQTATLYSILILIFVSLAAIDVLRAARQSQKVDFRQSIYRCMAPFIPLCITMLLLVSMLIPLAIGSSIYSFINNIGLATTPIEKVLWAMVFALSILLSMYLLSSSIFAFYIVTVPGMTPLLAIKSSRNIVRYRRLAVILRIVYLPILILLCMCIVLLPLIWFAPYFTEWVFFGLSGVGIVFAHTYLYTLYRELL